MLKNVKYSYPIIYFLGLVFIVNASLGIDGETFRTSLKRSLSEKQDALPEKRQRMLEDPAIPPEDRTCSPLLRLLPELQLVVSFKLDGQSYARFRQVCSSIQNILLGEKLTVHFDDFKKSPQNVLKMLEILRSRLKTNLRANVLDLLGFEYKFFQSFRDIIPNKVLEDLKSEIEEKLRSMPVLETLGLPTLVFRASPAPIWPILSQLRSLKNLTFNNECDRMTYKEENFSQLTNLKALRKLKLGGRFSEESHPEETFTFVEPQLVLDLKNLEAQLTALRSMEFGNMVFDLSDETIMHEIPTKLKSLTFLVQEGWPMFQGEHLSRLTRFANLKELSFYKDSLGELSAFLDLEIDEISSRNFTHLTKLKRLFIGFESIGTGVLRQMASMTNLEILELGVLEAVSAQEFAPLTHLPRLRILYLKGVPEISDTGDELPLKALTSLTELHLNFTPGLYDEELKLNETLQHLPEFRRCFFSVFDEGILPEGGRYLRRLLANYPNIEFNLISPDDALYNFQFGYPPYRQLTRQNFDFALKHTEKWLSGDDYVEEGKAISYESSEEISDEDLSDESGSQDIDAMDLE